MANMAIISKFKLGAGQELVDKGFRLAKRGRKIEHTDMLFSHFVPKCINVWIEYNRYNDP